MTTDDWSVQGVGGPASYQLYLPPPGSAGHQQTDAGADIGKVVHSVTSGERGTPVLGLGSMTDNPP